MNLEVFAFPATVIEVVLCNIEAVICFTDDVSVIVLCVNLFDVACFEVSITDINFTKLVNKLVYLKCGFNDWT